MEERRRYVRWSITRPLHYKIQGSNFENMGLVRDISMAGAGIFILEEYPKGSLLDLSLEIPDEVRPIKSQGMIVWQKRIQRENKEQFLTGIFFTRLRDEDKEKIYRYIRETSPDELSKLWWRELK